MKLNLLLGFLAQLNNGLQDADMLRRKSGNGGGHTELLIILTAALGLSMLLFVWAFFIRKRPKTTRGALVVERSKGKSSEEDPSRRKRRKRRPDHPENWGRNPTLGETGGLPPVRPEGEESSGSDDNMELPSGDDPPRRLRPQ